MTEQANGGQTAVKPAPVIESSLRDQLATVRQALAGSPSRRRLLVAALGMAVVIGATAGGQVLLNRWNQPFYDALQRRDMTGFLHQLMVFAMIAGGLLVLNVGQTWLNQRIRLGLRLALTADLIGEWTKPARGFRLAHAGAVGVNPDQRMQQDAGHLSDLSTDLGIGLFQACILLGSFVGVLWTLSSGFVFHIGAHSFAIPGYMVWAAILYAGIASGISWLVGRPLIRLNAERYAREAELRFSMVRVNEHADAIALARGEAGERRRLESDLGTVLDAVRAIFRAQIRLAWVTDTYGWITVIAPILVASPVYFAGDISFGGLMMAVGAFNQVHSSLRWFVNNIGGIADWRATLMRVADFRIALEETDVLHEGEERIDVGTNSEAVLTFEDLRIASPDGSTRLKDRHVEIKPGEHVVVIGDPGAGKTLFFRAIAGLWPWGGGSIGLPAGATPVFIPRLPYFSPVTLREVLGAGTETKATGDDELKAVLAEAGLERLGSSLDRVARWEHELNDEDQRLLAFAMLAVRQPQWIIIDETLDTFDAPALRRVMAIMEKRLAKATIITIGRGQPNRKFFTRTLRIKRDAATKPLDPPPVRAGAVDPPPTRTVAAKRLAKTAT